MPVARDARPVPGNGPFPARIGIFGEAPERNENRKGVPFVGKSGYFLDLFLGPWGAGVGRHHCYVSNVCKLWPGRGLDGKPLPPDDLDLLRDWPELHREIQEGGFELIIAVGARAFQWLTDLSLPLSVAHGYSYPLAPHLRPGRDIPVIAAYHPAAGMYSPEVMGNCLWDFRQVKRWLRGAVPDLRRDPSLRPQYQFFTEADIPEYERRWSLEPRAVGYDTEGHPGDPWSLQWSPGVGWGYILRHPISQRLRDWFRERVLAYADPLAIHSAVWDLRLDEELLGYSTIGAARSWFDTQIAGYLNKQESIQVGLKPTARRHLAVDMLTYDDAINSLRERQSEAIIYQLLHEGTTILDPQYTKAGKLKKKQKAAALTPLAARMERILLDSGRDDKGEGSERWSYYRRLKAVARDFPEADITLPAPELSDIDDKTYLAYAGADPDCTLGLYPVLDKQLDDLNLRPVLHLDQGAVPMFSRMNQVGIMADKEKLQDLGVDFEHRAEEHRQDIASVAGDPHFNPSKPQQLRWLLYHRLGMRCPVRTPKGDDSTNERALAMLAETHTKGENHEVMKSILAYRGVRKYVSTYVYPIIKKIRADGSVSPDLQLVNTATGRPAGLYVTIPAHTEDGKAIRSCHYAREGKKLTSTDLSGIEMRVAAHYFQEPTMIKLFKEGRDLHSETAAKFFNKPLEYIETKGRKTMREPIKRAGFGILYGISAAGLSATLALPPPLGCDLHLSVEECQELIDWWYDMFPRVRDGQREIRSEALRYGYVRGVSGRIRYFPNIRSPDEYARAAAIREMCNHPIQEGGQELMKRTMQILWAEHFPEWHEADIYLEPLLQIHDDLICETDEEYAEDWTEVVSAAMVQAAGEKEYRVPIDSGSKTGYNWGELK